VSDAFLEEQLRRIRQLSERMSQITGRHDPRTPRQPHIGHGPLHEVRDMRIVNSVPPRESTASGVPPPRSRRRR